MPTRKQQPDPIPESSQTIEEAADFWDTRSTAGYDHLMREVHFDVDLRRRTFLVPIKGNLAREITTAMARAKGNAP